MTAILNRFISRLADRYIPFFLLMNKCKGFEWTEECALAFQKLKEYLSHPSIMSSPKMNEVLFAYIVVALHAVSLVLIRVDNGIQMLVYYVSRSLHEAEIRYLPLEKAILAVVHVRCNLLHNTWMENQLTQLSRKNHYTGKCMLMEQQTKGDPKWGLVLISPEKFTIEKSLRLGFSATNNEVEYKALLEGMSMVQKMGGKAVKMFSNSRLVVSQVRGELEAGDERM